MDNSGAHFGDAGTGNKEKQVKLPDRWVDSEELLLDTVRAETGLSDYGESSFLVPLRVLLQSLDSDLERGPSERMACFNLLKQPLVSRLYAQAGWNRNPEVLSQPLVRPVFIVGAPRTGTTALHQLMVADPAWQGLENWLVMTPMIRPPRAKWDSVPEYRRQVAEAEARLLANPALRSKHFVEPHHVDECLRVMSQTLASNRWGSLMTVPSYDTWFRRQDIRPSYRRLADNMRLIGANDRDKRWLNKNPAHVLNIEELLEVFPDSLVIHTHRDPLKSFPSFWSLMSNLQPYDGPSWTSRKTVERETPLWADGLNRSIGIQQRHPDRILDVYQRDIAGRPLELLEEIYAFVGQPLTGETRQQVHDWIAANPEGKHGEHRYSLADFDATEDEILRHVGPYRAHHGFDRIRG